MIKKNSQKAKFGSKLGLIAATVGSAVGLGNIWRFPAEVQQNGGGAFLLVYILCVFLLGVPVMLADFSLGRSQQSDSVNSFKKLSPQKPWWLTGAMAILASFFILGFYMVVAGWTLDYLWESITGTLYAPAGAADSMVGNTGLESHFSEMEEQYINSDTHALWATLCVMVLNFGVMLFGIKKGIEKASMVMMPLLFVLLVVFACVSLTLDKAAEGLAFFFKPDFSAITPSTIINALGQAFFSLSLGMGVTITYAAYYPKTVKLTSTAVTVSMCDLLVAVMMGIVICPVIATFGFGAEDMAGSTLVFVTMPEVFAQMPSTQLWSSLFFILLFIAALTSTISISEVVVAFVQEQFKMRRVPACLAVMVVLAPLCALCALSQGTLADFKIFGYTVFDLLDTVTTNFFLPVVALFTCIFVGWIVPKTLMHDQLTNHGLIKAPVSAIYLSVKYLCPVLILMILIASWL